MKIIIREQKKCVINNSMIDYPIYSTEIITPQHIAFNLRDASSIAKIFESMQELQSNWQTEGRDMHISIKNKHQQISIKGSGIEGGLALVTSLSLLSPQTAQQIYNHCIFSAT